MKETRIKKLLVSKAGGNASAGSVHYRLTIPNAWITHMGITTESREVTITLDGNRIIIEKAE